MTRRILVAEDDHGVRTTLGFVLEDAGYEVLYAEDGEQALAAAREEGPDLILLDNLMPKLDGKQVFMKLRAEEHTRSIPVMVLSGMDREPGDEWEGAQFVGKPFSFDDLIERIGRLLGDA
jgi:DNA-binding response OmpR family regulator